MFAFSIITPEGVLYENEIERVTVPTMAGEITILKKHTPIVSALRPGILTVKHADGTQLIMSVSGGLVEVRPSGQAVILADTAERAEDIDLERAQAARKRAEEFMNQKDAETEIQHADMVANLQKELARIKASELYRGSRK